LTALAIRVDGVDKRYGEFVAVDALSFEVPRGVVYGVLGPNGAGKSTTLRMINDIIGPDAGSIEILDGLAPGREAARRIGYLPEERGLYPKMKVAELLQFFGELRGVARATAAKRAGDWLERLEIADWADNKVQDLSKGMQQKVQFVTALIHEPDLLILDEPWSGLDPINAEVLRDIVAEQKAAGKTILFSTHLMEQAEKICDRVCIIARGRKVLEGDLADIKREAGSERRVAFRFGAGQDDAVDAILADQTLVSAIHDDGADRFAELADGATARQLLEALVATEVEIRQFEVFEPSLHQIFVERVEGAETETEPESETETEPETVTETATEMEIDP
jgi:ABC-2 type transport system ATP-binding protein